MIKIYSGLLLIFSLVILPSVCDAQLPQYSKGSGTGSNSYPFSSTAGLKTQHLYVPGDLPGAVSGTITRLYFRTVTPNATASFTNFYLKLGQTTATQFPGSGLTFATGLTDVVYGATYTVTATTGTGSGDWFYIDLQNPFVFDAAQSLILEVVWTTKTSGGFNVRTSTGPGAPNNKRLTSSSPTALTGSASSNWMDFGIELANPLNVKLSNFTANANGGDVNIYWQTADEVNLLSYEIERSEDGASFKTIGSVPANEAVSSGNNYRFTDANAFIDGAASFYYRLKIIEKGNKTEYTKVIRVVADELKSPGVSVFPNPFTRGIYVSLVASSDSKASFYISDLTGRCVAKGTEDLRKGKNVCSISETERLSPGCYLLTISNDGATSTHSIFKR